MKKVVVIGGGFAGTYLAKSLENIFSVTLIDTKDYFEFTPSILKTIVNTSQRRKIQILHSHYLHKTSLIHGEVTSFTSQEVILKNKKISFDYLFVCTGSGYHSPIKGSNIVLPNRARDLRKAHAQLEDAKTVLIVGGGLVGVELAAEIAGSYFEKKIVFVHAGKTLLERNPERVQKYAFDYLKKRGVRILLGEFVFSKGKEFVTKNGKKINTDICFFCTGISPNTSLFQKNFFKALNLEKFVHVKETLQLVNYPHIFVVGDLNDIPEEKTAQGAEKQARVAAYNVFALESGKELHSYFPTPKVMVISLGKWNGIFIYKNFILFGIIPALLKKLVEWKTIARYRF